jgi:ATP-binding cassette subfamily F protein 3
MLGAFLFRGDDVYKPISVLSGGEKSRLALLKMLLKPMNLLILDEPTNHLDLHSKDILLDTLKQYPGTIIFVSHDRAFMEALSTKTLELSRRAPGAQEPAAARLFYGDYAYYLDRLQREGPEAVGTITESAPERAAPPPVKEEREREAAPLPKTILIKGQERREAEKQRQALIRRLERQEAEILQALEALEAEKAALEEEMGRPEVYSQGEKARAVRLKLDTAAGDIEIKTREWEEKAAELARQRRLSL